MGDELVSVDEGAVSVLQPVELISEMILGAKGLSNSGVKLRAIPPRSPVQQLAGGTNDSLFFSSILSSEEV